MKALVISERITDRQTESFKKYLKEVHNIPRITVDEEYELSLRIQNGDEEARNKLVKANLRFVISVAKQYPTSKVSIEDLVNEGNYGLIEASKRFDPTTGFKFISYAVWWIRRYIIEFLTKTSRTIRIPSNQAANITKLTKIINELEQNLERKPTFNELMDYQPIVDGEFSENDIKFFINLEVTNTSSLDKTFGDDSNSTLVDTIESNFLDPNDNDIYRSDNQIKSEILIKQLDGKPMQKLVIMRLFGLGGYEAQSLKQIAEYLEISRERARQIKDNALRTLKSKVNTEQLNWMLNG